MDNRIAKKLVLIGWSYADWRMLDPIIEAGHMPTLKKLKGRTSNGNMVTKDPPEETSSWISLNTGQNSARSNCSSPIKLRNGKIYPFSSLDNKVKSIWNILSEHGIKSHQVGSFGSHPAEQLVDGISVSEFFPVSSNRTISPISKIKEIEKLRVYRDEISRDQLKKFIPTIDSLVTSQTNSDKIELVKEFIAHVNSIHNVTRHIIQNEEWEFLACYFTQTSWLSHQFIDDHMLSIDSESPFSGVLMAAYSLLDEFLGNVLDLIEFDYHLFLVSPIGFKPHEQWLKSVREFNGASEFTTKGIQLMKGRQYSPQAKVLDAGALDITPTITSLFGLPISVEFNEGQILILAKYLKSKLEQTDSFGLPITADIDESAFDEAILKFNKERLVRIGFLESSSNVDEVKNRLEYLKARSLLSAGQIEEGKTILENLWEKYPEQPWVGGRLAGAYFMSNDEEKFLDQIDRVILLEKEIPEIHLLKANHLMQQQKYRSASKEMQIAAKNPEDLPNIFNQIGRLYASMHQTNLAQKFYAKEAESHPSVESYMTLAMFLINNNQFKRAIDPFEKVLSIATQHPIAMMHLGGCFYKTKQYKEAQEILERAKTVAIDQKSFNEITRMLMDIYNNQLPQPHKIQEIQKRQQESIGKMGTITIVSGLPRSGTSMMMQMLKEGGMELFTDGKREADDNNKKGYYEHEAVKSIAKSKRFLAKVEQRALKVISHLLHHLPHLFKYKIIFMDRDISEVMHSQHKMLGRLGKERGENAENSLKLLEPFQKSRQKAISWCRNNHHFIDLLIIPYSEVTTSPIAQAYKINQFLGGTLDEQKMAAAVDPSLYREKHK